MIALVIVVLDKLFNAAIKFPRQVIILCAFTYPFDEFAFVLKGSAKVDVHGGESFSIGAGDILYVEEGTTIDFEMSDDFEDITMLVSDKPVAWR